MLASILEELLASKFIKLFSLTKKIGGANRTRAGKSRPDSRKCAIRVSRASLDSSPCGPL